VTASKGLRLRLRAFVRAYVETGNGSEAIRRISPDSKRPDCAAAKLLAKPRIQAAVAEYERSMDEEVRQRRYANLRALQQIANFDPLWAKKPLEEWPEEVRCVIQGIDVEKRFAGNSETPIRIEVVKFRFASKIEARKLLMQYQRMLDDRPSLPPIQVNVGTQVTIDGRIVSNDPIEASLEYERLMSQPQPPLPEPLKLSAPVAVT
jgi:hypothetical protein